MVNRTAVREKLRTAVRRGIGKVEPLEKIATERANTRRRTARLAELYVALRDRYTMMPRAEVDADSLPTVPQIKQVEQASLAGAAAASFLRIVANGADVDRAAITMTRELIADDLLGRARSFAQVIQQRAGLEAIGDLCLALVAAEDPMPLTAWELLTRNDPELVMRHAAVVYFRIGFAVDPAAATAMLDRVIAGELHPDLGAPGWLNIARASFAAKVERQSLWALDRAERLLGQVANEKRRNQMKDDLDWLRTWYGRYEAARGPVELPAGEIPFAVIDYKQPDLFQASVNLGDAVQTLASLGHVVRHTGFRYTGEPDLVEVAEKLRQRVRPEQVIEGEPATIRLHTLNRDVTNYAALPEGTWTLAFGWYMHPVFDLHYDLPFNPRLRPIFVSFHMNARALLNGQAIEFLRAHAPVGCRDWNTVFLLQACDIPAFFSGCLTTTIDTLFPDNPQAQPSGTLYVDYPPDAPGDYWEQANPLVRVRSIAENLVAALDRVQSYRDEYRKVITSRLHCYLPARSIGGNAEFRPDNPADARFDGLAGISDAEFDTMRTKMRDKLAAVFSAIAAGKSEDEVYAIWREVCADDVAYAWSRRSELGDIEPTTFDVATACKVVHENSVIIERSQPGPDGEEINVEFSLDGNLKNAMGIVLDSIVAHASRPIRLFVLCRDHGPDDYAAMAKLFPTVSFVWLPTDHVDYGRIIGMIKHITVATMDRLLLPDLLPEVDKIIHHDLDALCLADLAELWETELGDKPLAARDSPHPNFGSGFLAIIRASKRLKADQRLARELIMRSHIRHAFDFEQFNAGIMVLNLDRMRRDDFCRHFLPYAERFGLNDQEILNVYAGAERVPFDKAWNAYPRLEVMHDPKILHWLGAMKPWNNAYVGGRELWRAGDAAFRARKRTVLAS